MPSMTLYDNQSDRPHTIEINPALLIQFNALCAPLKISKKDEIVIAGYYAYYYLDQLQVLKLKNRKEFLYIHPDIAFLLIQLQREKQFHYPYEHSIITHVLTQQCYNPKRLIRVIRALTITPTNKPLLRYGLSIMWFTLHQQHQSLTTECIYDWVNKISQPHLDQRHFFMEINKRLFNKMSIDCITSWLNHVLILIKWNTSTISSRVLFNAHPRGREHSKLPVILCYPVLFQYPVAANRKKLPHRNQHPLTKVENKYAFRKN